MTPTSRPAAPRPVRFLPAILFSPRRPVVYLITAVALSLAGAIALSAVANALLPDVEGPDFPLSGWKFMFAVAVFAPVVETAILAIVLEGLRPFVAPWTAVWICSAGWALAHSSAAPAWGLVIWWPFILFSLTYLVWRERSVLAAYGMALGVHAIQNTLAAAPSAFS